MKCPSCNSSTPPEIIARYDRCESCQETRAYNAAILHANGDHRLCQPNCKEN